MSTKSLCILLLIFAVSVFGQSPIPENCNGCPNLIPVVYKGLRPDGLEWTLAQNFLVSSLTYGTINRVSDDGIPKQFIADKRFQSTLGLKVVGDTLLIANVNGSVIMNKNTPCTNQNSSRCVISSLMVANIGTATVTYEVDLTPFALGGVVPYANSVTADSNGNAYVTDSNLNQIYQIKYSTGKVSSIITSTTFNSGYTRGTVGLNGIDYSAKDNVIIAARTDNGKLYRISLSYSGSASSIREVGGINTLPGVNGLKFVRSTGNLVVVSGTGRTIAMLSSNDSWNTARVVGVQSTPYLSATSAASRLGEVYIVHSHVEQSLNYSVYEIERVVFSSAPITSPSPRPNTVSLPLLNNKLIGDWRTKCVYDNKTNSSSVYTLHIGGRSWNVKADAYFDKNCKNAYYTYFVQGTFFAYNVTQPPTLPRISGSYSISNSPSISMSRSNSASPGTASPSGTASVSRGHTPTPSPSAFYKGVIANDPSLYVYIPGAYPADFIVTSRKLTPHTQAAAAFFNQTGCGLSPFYVDQDTSVKLENCSVLNLANENATTCPYGERDVLYYTSTSIFLGDRANSATLCELPRPTALGWEFVCVSGSACSHSKYGGDRFSPDGKDIAIFVIVIVALLLCLCCLCVLLIVLLIKG